MKGTWAFLVLGGLVFWWLWGINVDATVEVVQEEIITTYRPTPPGGLGYTETDRNSAAVMGDILFDLEAF